MTREPIYAALFAKLSNSANYVTKSRRLLHWTDVGPEDCPALFQAQGLETVAQLKGQGKSWTFHVNVYVYVHTNSQQLASDASPSTLLNPLLDALETALAIDDFSNNACTLGGLCSRAWIDGNIETSEGTLGDHEVAIVPISIMVPAT